MTIHTAPWLGAALLLVACSDPRLPARSATGTPAAARVTPERPPQAPETERLLQVSRGVSLCAQGSVRECQAACEEGDGVACEQLGTVYLLGRRVPQDLARAEGAFTRACDAGNAGVVGGCVWLGMLHQPVGCRPGGPCLGMDLFGRPSDARKAGATFWRACDAGSAGGCRRLVEMVRDRAIAPRAGDLVALLGKLEGACEASGSPGHEDACAAMLAIADARLFTSETRPDVQAQLAALCRAGRQEFCGREKDVADAP